MDFDRAIASQHRRSIVLRTFLGLNLLGTFLSLWACWNQHEFYTHIADGGAFDVRAAQAVDDLTAIAALLKLVLFLAAGIAWLTWFRCAYGNLKLIGNGRTEHGPGWAIGAWFVPFLNIVRPFTMTREVWTRSAAAIDGSQARRAKAPILGFWWAFWLIGNIVDYSVAQMGVAGNSIDDALVVSNFGIGAELLGIGQCITAFLVVRGIDQFQSRVGPKIDEVF